jgi:1-acyl-sn-glycerol-3-phosphate acyltransferase
VVAGRTIVAMRRDPDPAPGADPLEPPEAPVPPWRRGIRYWATKAVVHVGVRCLVRLRVEGLELLPPGPSLLCANHQSWADPIVALAALPGRPRLFFFGPKEEDMTAGGRNRLMLWTGTAVPFKPAKSDLRETARRVAAVFDAGHRLLIFGEGRIHAREGELLPLQDGAVWLATRSKVPIVPVAIVGTSWLGFGRTIRVRIGEPIATEGRGGREGLEALTVETWCALYRLSQGAPEKAPPGRLGRWLTEAFNDWPEGERPAETPGAVGPAARAGGTARGAEGGPVEGPHGPCPPA